VSFYDIKRVAEAADEAEPDYDYDDDYEDDYEDENEPTCDHCGRPQNRESPHYVSAADRADDWNSLTGNHKSCDYRQIIEEMIDKEGV